MPETRQIQRLLDHRRLQVTTRPDAPFLAGMMQDVLGELPPAPLRGEIKDSRKEIESKTVEFQKGKLDCKGYSTRSIQKFDGGKLQTHTTRSVWVTNLVPFGFAESGAPHGGQRDPFINPSPAQIAVRQCVSDRQAAGAVGKIDSSRPGPFQDNNACSTPGGRFFMTIVRST